MNKTLIFKGIVIYTFIFLMCVSIACANSSIIPVGIMLLLSIPFSKMVKNMSEDDLHQVFLVPYLQSKFENNPIIKDMTKE